MGARRLMPIVLTLGIFLGGCSVSPTERPRDGSARVGRETVVPADATPEGNISNVTIRFIDDAEVAATATAQAQVTPVPPTLIPPPQLGPTTPTGIVAGASPVPGGLFVIGQTDGVGANVRESPSTSAPVLGNLAEGTLVERLDAPVSSEGRAWQRVRSGSLEGWVVAVVVRSR
jgi:hypothetical protein